MEPPLDPPEPDVPELEPDDPLLEVLGAALELASEDFDSLLVSDFVSTFVPPLESDFDSAFGLVDE